MKTFRWHDWNLGKMEKHDVAPLEAEHVVCNAITPYPRQIGGGRWQVVGRGQGDRMVQVGYVLDDDGTVFIIHAMPLTTRRRH